MNATRRTVQLTAILALLALPMISRGAALYTAFGPGATHVGTLGTSWEYFLYEAYSFLFGWIEDPVALSDQYHGAYWSITIGGVTVSDPLALLGHILATQSIHWPLVLGAITPIILAVLMGRVFCGWICPAGTIFEFTAMFRAWLERRLILVHLPNFVPPATLRWLVLVGGAIFSLAAGVGAFALILPYVLIARDWYLMVFGMAFGFGILFVVTLMALELLAMPRLWCRSLCPTGLALGLLGRKRIIGVGPAPEKTCTSGCNLCARVCPVQVDPLEGLGAEECMMCGACEAACPADVLSTGLISHRPGRSRVLPAAALICSLLTTIVFGSPPVSAHHIKGLPHYGYIENYPQAPAIETEILAPPYTIIVVTYAFEGLDVTISDTPHDVVFYVAVSNEAERNSWMGPLQIEFRSRQGGATVIRSFDRPLEESVYRTRVTLPDDAYDVTIRIMDDQSTEAQMTFRRSGGPNWYLIVSLAAAAITAVVIALIGRRRRAARRRAIGLDQRNVQDI